MSKAVTLTNTDIVFSHCTFPYGMYQMFKTTPITSVEMDSCDVEGDEAMNETFCECTSLTSVNIHGSNEMTIDTMEGLCASCTALSSLIINQPITVNDISRLASYTIISSIDLSHITIDDTGGAEEAFNNVATLTSIEWPIFSNLVNLSLRGMLISTGFTNLEVPSITVTGTLPPTSLFYFVKGLRTKKKFQSDIINLDEAIEVFSYVQQNYPELFKLFYEASGAELKGGEFQVVR